MPGNPSTLRVPCGNASGVQQSPYPDGKPSGFASSFMPGNPSTGLAHRSASTPETALRVRHFAIVTGTAKTASGLTKTGAASPHWLRNALPPLLTTNQLYCLVWKASRFCLAL
ncbi:hypothetical protein PCC6912_26510 [Chlorogloeopsis fritschii PCC 6912]|uniref:Uncharacterized protein n=1 Tax=Chlorogloeopsis fritschii PCC 6912 TaxID=211165 RepID=A0A433NHC3_CHLFR|nr:hypothetical protein PCC6912_26510 [Chlorogloeopsis fritschii PCC 6912]